jgi:hypothetical protein
MASATTSDQCFVQLVTTKVFVATGWATAQGTACRPSTMQAVADLA